MSFTDIFAAAQEGTVDDVKSFLDKGVDVNAKDKYGQTPLHIAVGRENIEIVKFLVSEKGADVNAKEVDEKTPLHLAASYNDKVEIARFLVSNGADVKAKNNGGYTPLHKAVGGKNVELVRYLVMEGKADVEAKDGYGDTPLNTAVLNGRSAEIIKFLVSEGKANVNAPDDDYSTPLHSVAMKQNIEFAKILISSGKADVNAKDKRGLTPLGIALHFNNTELINIFNNVGTNENAKDHPSDKANIFEDTLPTDAEEQINLGVNYLKGDGVPKDMKKAVSWFTKAAEQGNAGAQYNLGLCYANGGDGVPKDIEKAIYWYTKAAEQGFAEAQYMLACGYATGDGVPKDMEKAIYWFTKAAEQGLEEAKKMMEKGIECKTHPSKATDEFCSECGEPICEDCRIVLRGFCYKCLNNELNDDITRIKKQMLKDKSKKVGTIILLAIGTLFGMLAIAANPIACALCIWIFTGILGNLGAAFSAFPRVYRNGRDNFGDSFFEALKNAFGYCILFELLLKSLAGPVYPIIRIQGYNKEIKNAESAISENKKLLRKMSDYYEYAQYIDQHRGNIDLANLTRQGNALSNNEYAKSVLNGTRETYIEDEKVKLKDLYDEYIFSDKKPSSKVILSSIAIGLGITIVIVLALSILSFILRNTSTENETPSKYSKPIVENETITETPSKPNNNSKPAATNETPTESEIPENKTITENETLTDTQDNQKEEKVTLASETLTDSRDNQTYKTIKIGNQTWIAQNLNYKAQGSKCYGNDESNCQIYGRLYNWETAMKACPVAAGICQATANGIFFTALLTAPAAQKVLTKAKQQANT